MPNEIIALEKDLVVNAFNNLKLAYEELEGNPTDEKYEVFKRELDNTREVIYNPLEKRMNEHIEKVDYDLSKLTIWGDFSISLRMDVETTRLWKLYQKALEENVKYWKDKCKKFPNKT